MDCKECNKEWQDRYTIAVRRFDKALNIAMTVTIISILIAFICVIISAVCLSQTLQFIRSFEYIEETETIIEQDGDGQNFAVVYGDRNA